MDFGTKRCYTEARRGKEFYVDAVYTYLGTMLNFLKHIFRPKTFKISEFQPETPSPEAVYVNHFIIRAIECKETMNINRSNLVNIPEYNIDASDVSFDGIVSRCKELMSHHNPLPVVRNKGQAQEDLVQFTFEEDNIYISVVT
jgi:hypothetical protein